MKDMKMRSDQTRSIPSSARGFIRWFWLGAVMLLMYQAVRAQNFTKVNTPSIPALTHAHAHWVDFNNDNLLDLFIAGIAEGGTMQTAIYINNGNATFNTISLSALADIAVDFGDYNNDGYIDLVLSGITSDGEKKTRVYQNNNGISFTLKSFVITPLVKGDVLWKDLDRDGDLDILISGINDQNQKKTLVYEFSNNDYHVRNTTLPGVSNGQLKIIDLHLDGNPEVMITGLNESGSPVTLLYLIDKDLNFTLHSDSQEGTAFNAVVAADLNGDKYEDLVITGLAGDGLNKKTSVLRNNTLGDFIQVSTGLMNLSSSSVVVGDLDNDGLADIILTGQDNAQPDEMKHFKYYKNNASFSFSSEAHTMKNIYQGDAALGDYDNDGDLDIFQIGASDINFEANLYASDQAISVANNAPVAPANLAVSTNGNSVTLSWSRPADDHTSSNSLSFNLYLSKNPGGADLMMAPMSDRTTGFRRIASSGNNGTAAEKTFENLPEGKYYWSVQAIDNGYKSSTFSPEQSFVICDAVNIGRDTLICYDQNIHLEAGTATDVVNWYSVTDGLLLSNSNTIDFQVTQSARIVAEVTKQHGCIVKDTLVVTMSPLPVVNLGSDQAICFKDEFSIQVSDSYDSVNWLNMNGLLRANATNYAYHVTKKDTLIVQVFDVLRCVNYDSIIVEVNQLPVVTIGNDKQICYGEQASFSVTGTWPTVNWKTVTSGNEALNTSTYSYKVVMSDIVVATVIDGAGCINVDSAKVEMLALPIINLSTNSSVCYEQSTLLEVTPNPDNTYSWYLVNNQPLTGNVHHYSHHVLHTDTVLVRAVNSNACTNVDSVIVTVIPLPKVNLGDDAAVCFDNSILLQAGTGFHRVDWLSKSKNIVLEPDSWFYNYHVTETDTIIARVQSMEGCFQYDSIRIERLELPVFSLGADIQVCSQEVVNLDIPGTWKEVNWYTVTNILLNPGSATFNFQLEESQEIRAEVFNNNGCVDYDTLGITMLELPVFDLGTDKTYCAGDQAALNITQSGVTYFWHNEANDLLSNDAQYEFEATASGNIFLTVTNSDLCKYTDFVAIQVNALPVFSIEGTTEICSGDIAQLSVDFPWQSIAWHRLENADTVALDAGSFIIALKATADIYATVLDVNQCKRTQSFSVTVNNNPVALAGEDALLCYGESNTLGGIYGNEQDLQFEWSPAQYINNHTTARPVTKPEQTTTYIVKVRDAHGCSSADTVYVEVNPEIIVEAGNKTSICTGETFMLGGEPTASGSKFPYTYQWLTDKGEVVGDEANVSVVPAKTTTYFVFVSTGKCEVVYDSVIVTVNEHPLVTISENQSIGEGSSIQLNASGGVKYAWTPVESLDNIASGSPVASPVKTTTYKVVVTDENNCSSSATVEVVVQNNLFIPNLFTPNGDGSNDTFRIYGTGIEWMTLSIHDEKGNRVFYTESSTEAFETGWNGTWNGRMLKNDIYIWTIEGKFYNGEEVQYRGRKTGIIKLMR
jgi:gliding motility-associated-like protein